MSVSSLLSTENLLFLLSPPSSYLLIVISGLTYSVDLDVVLVTILYLSQEEWRGVESSK